MKTQQTQLVIRINQKLKKETMAKAKQLGLNLSALTKMFYVSLINNSDAIKIDKEKIKEAIFDKTLDDALKSKEVKNSIIKLADAVQKKYGNHNHKALSKRS